MLYFQMAYSVSFLEGLQSIILLIGVTGLHFHRVYGAWFSYRLKCFIFIWFTVFHFYGVYSTTLFHRVYGASFSYRLQCFFNMVYSPSFHRVYSASFSYGLQRYIFLGLQGFIFFIEVTGLYILHRGYRASFLYGVQPLINIWVTVLHFHRGCCA